MQVSFDFITHWLWSIVVASLTLSGLTMVGAQYGWILNYDIASADLIHRVMAASWVMLSFIIIYYEVIRIIENETKKLAWLIIGTSGYRLFTLITSLIFIITGAIIWICMETNMAAAAFSIYVHEQLTYILVVSLIWHIYDKSHALVWTKSKQVRPKTKKIDKEIGHIDAETVV